MNSRIHIFYMEDEPVVLKNWVEILKDDNYQVTAAKDSAEALKAIDEFIKKDELVSFFLLDIMIIPYSPFSKEETIGGNITGLKVADYIRENYKKVYAGYKIIFLTAIKDMPGEYAKLVDEYASVNSEECFVITKPIDYTILKRRLQHANG